MRRSQSFMIWLRRFSNHSKLKLPRFPPIWRQLRIQQENFQNRTPNLAAAGFTFCRFGPAQEKFSLSRSSIQFYFIISQARSTAAGRDQGSACESEFLPPQKHAPLPKNVNRLKSQEISAGFSTIQQGRRCTYSCTAILVPVLLDLVDL